ncbi:hypothetical protein CRE_09782 [Caenorhabditis remanei]|uniref:F-box domain-containing protein n=1 Tax=Caenorhabditis remanei TaxID=31234 RepID=E3NDE4_CAERE|nr:hypothetical protein CRE_09782 [Caenorhabditis remanei]
MDPPKPFPIMDPPKPFPILRLPFLAIEEVFKAMIPFEIIHFSLITKRTKAVAMHMSFYPKYSIELYIKKVPKVSIKGTTLISTYFVESMYKGPEERNACLERKVLKYSTDPIEKWKRLCIYVMEIFKKKSINVFSMQMDTYLDQNVSIIDFLKTNVKSVDICNLDQSEEENDVDEHTIYLLDNLKVSKEFSSQLIGYENLLKIDCRHVTLRNNQITNEEWNMFLKKWIAMETNLNLEYFKLGYQELDEFRGHVLHDIPYEVVDKGVKRSLLIVRNRSTEISGGIDIRRIDGKTATFFMHRELWTESLAMSIH